MKSSYKIPTWSPEKNWHYTKFPNKEAFRVYVKSLFKEPGKYKFDETSFKFNEHSRFFTKNKVYTIAPEDSQDFYEYWDTEKEKCKKGVIFHNDKGDSWYLTRWYYHWINFLQIYDKRPSVKSFNFPDVMDHQYHVCLYEMCAILHGKDEAALKKRQMAWSYMHEARMYNCYLFDSGFVGKMVASDKKYINATGGEWKFLDEYHNFNNTHTAWACSNNPHKEFSWKQQVEQKTVDGRKVFIGSKATISGITLDKDPISGVGGACDLCIYVEGGIAPSANITHGFMKPAMNFGGIKTGTFNIGGSVGDLDQCEPLKDMIENPEGHDIYAIESNLLDENGTIGMTGLFIPEQWGYSGETEETNCIDQYGNSLVEKALEVLNKKYTQAKLTKKHEDYQLAVSQGPRNIAEAFAIRKVSVFPVRHTAAQTKRIEDGEVYLRYVELERDEDNSISFKITTDRKPCPYPIKLTEEDKRGVVVVHEFPGKSPEWGDFYFSVDPVEVGKSETSDSLAAIYIYKNPVKVTQIDEEGNSTTYIERGKLVCEWVGRYDDPNETNEQLSKVVEWYNAWGISENNKTSFNNYMILKRRVKHLAPSTEMLYDKEIGVSQNVYQKFGWSKTGSNETGIWKKMLTDGINYLSEELKEDRDEEDKVVKVHYGVERIPFIWLLKEMQEYQPKKNFDRVIAYCALISFAKIQEAAREIKEKTERVSDTNKKHTFTRSNFLKSVGRQQQATQQRPMQMYRSVGKQQLTVKKK